MAKPDEKSLAGYRASTFRRACRKYKALPVAGSRPLHVITGVSPSGEVVGDFDSKLQEITDVLKATGRLYEFNDEIVLDRGTGEHGQLIGLAGQSSVEPMCGPLLTNFLICERPAKSEDD